MAAATASVNRPPPAHPGPNGGNLPSYSGLPNPGQQHPGLNGTGQDPGPPLHPQHHVPAQPLFYVPAPPPAPFLQYQWPIPFPYNPFAGFPGMGYGMVMPPLPPPPYMEHPAYILPHPHIQPVDYRRLLHPQVQVPSAPYQNPNQPRRIRQPHTVPRETVNSAVQTEPTHRGVGGYGDGNPHTRSDSGHGTASLSPPTRCSSPKQGSVEVENYSLPTCNAKDEQVYGTSTNDTISHGSDKPHPKGTKAVQSCIRAPGEPQKCHTDSVGQENVPLFRKGHCNMWSVGSPDSIVPVCSSLQQEDENVKERRASVPDILMRWAGSSPQAVVLKMADTGLHQNDQQLPSYGTEAETEKSLYPSPTEPKNGPVVADGTEVGDDADNVLNCKDSKTLFKIVKLPFALHDLPSSRRESELVGTFGSVRQCLTYKDEMLHSPNTSHMLPDNEQENGKGSNPHEDTTEINPFQMSSNSNPMKRRMNESVWSVESLVPFIPTKEWMLQKGTFEPEMIIEMTEEAENGGLSTPSDNLLVKSSKRRLSRRFSFSDAGPMSDSWLIYNSPAEKLSSSKKSEMQCEIDVSEDGGPQQCRSAAPSEKDPLVSPTALRSKIIVSIPTEEDVDENGSSEPEANRSPNQESVIEQQEKSPCSPEQEHALLLNPVAGVRISPSDQLMLQNGVDMEVENGTCGNEEVSQLRNEQLSVPMTDQSMAQVSLSKGHLVECGVQCTNLQDCKTCKQPECHKEPDTRPRFKNPDAKRANGKAEGFGMNGQGHKNQRRQGMYRNRGQDNPSGQRESYYGYQGKPGKSKGGNGRNNWHER